MRLGDVVTQSDLVREGGILVGPEESLLLAPLGACRDDDDDGTTSELARGVGFAFGAALGLMPGACLDSESFEAVVATSDLVREMGFFVKLSRGVSLDDEPCTVSDLARGVCDFLRSVRG